MQARRRVRVESRVLERDRGLGGQRGEERLRLGPERRGRGPVHRDHAEHPVAKDDRDGGEEAETLAHGERPPDHPAVFL